MERQYDLFERQPDGPSRWIDAADALAEKRTETHRWLEYKKKFMPSSRLELEPFRLKAGCASNYATEAFRIETSHWHFEAAKRPSAGSPAAGRLIELRSMRGACVKSTADFASLKRSSGLVRIWPALNETVRALMGAFPEGWAASKSARNAPD